MSVRMNVYLSELLHDEFEKHAQELGVSKSALAVLCIQQYMDQRKVLQYMPTLVQMNDRMNEIEDMLELLKRATVDKE